MRRLAVFSLFAVFWACNSVFSAEPLKWEGRAVEADGKTPVADVEVTAEPMYGKERDASRITVKTGADGRFAIEADVSHKQWQLYVKDKSGRPCVGYPHLDESKDFGDLKVNPCGALSGTVMGPENKKLFGVDIELRLRLTCGCSHYVSAGKVATDKDGAFAFEGLTPGTYQCLTSDPRFSPSPNKVDVSKDFSFLEMHLKKAAVVRGKVVDRQGNPVGGVRVYSSGNDNECVSGEDGKYEIAGLPAGDDRIKVEAKGYAPHCNRPLVLKLVEGQTMDSDIVLEKNGSVQVTFKPESADMSIPEKVSLELEVENDWHSGYDDIDVKVAGGVATLDNIAPGKYTLKFAYGSQELGDVSATAIVESEKCCKVALRIPAVFSLEGVIKNEKGEPIEGVTVSCQKKKGEGGFCGAYFWRHATTDAKGRFKVKGLGKGDYTLGFSSENYINRQQSVTVGVEGQKPGSSVKVEYVLNAGVTLAGTVTGEDGEPVAGVEVTAEEVEAVHVGFSGIPDKNSSSDGTGKFVVKGLSAKKYVVFAKHDIYVPAQKEVTLKGGENPPLDFKLVKGLSISGTVTEGDGSPAAGLSLHLFGPLGDFSRRFNSKNTTSKDNGSFRFNGLKKGRYEITIQPDNDNFNRHEVSGVEAGTEMLMIALAKRHEILVQAVLEDGTPVADAAIDIQKVAREGEGRMYHNFDKKKTDVNGELRISLREGDHYTVKAMKELLLPSAKYVSLLPGKTDSIPQKIVLNMLHGYSISGTVVTKSDGKPVAGMVVKQMTADHSFLFGNDGDDGVPRAKTDAEGRFTIRGLPFGMVKLAVMEGGETPHVVHQGIVNIPRKGKAEDVRFELPVLAMVRGVVRDGEGKPIPGAVIVINSPADVSMMMRTMSAKDGCFVFENVKPGSYYAQYFDTRGSGLPQIRPPVPFVVKDGEKKELELGGAKK